MAGDENMRSVVWSTWADWLRVTGADLKAPEERLDISFVAPLHDDWHV
ncbi:hypothetical protein [Deinococcus aquaedulcis]|nr:hypothetical protein [Deinococcus aquaedulcis]